MPTGMLGAAEEGIAGVPVLLYADVDMDGVFDPRRRHARSDDRNG